MSRPCSRCTYKGLEDSCIDVCRRPRKRNKIVVEGLEGGKQPQKAGSNGNFEHLISETLLVPAQFKVSTQVTQVLPPSELSFTSLLTEDQLNRLANLCKLIGEDINPSRMRRKRSISVDDMVAIKTVEQFLALSKL